jgi:hypothetical protein
MNARQSRKARGRIGRSSNLDYYRRTQTPLVAWPARGIARPGKAGVTRLFLNRKRPALCFPRPLFVATVQQRPE